LGKQHWADEMAGRLEGSGGETVISTGISPSGPIHIGNMREVVTADAVNRALQDRGLPTTFYYIADDFDNLRKVYPFLDPEVYQQYVGQPLSRIPGPADDGKSYADHFLAPFLTSLDRLGIETEVVRLHELYESGRMVPAIKLALENRDKVAQIIDQMTKREPATDWSPFTPICNSCKRLTGTKTVGFDSEAETVDYTCDCGDSGQVSMAGGGKLVWRVDWPAKWMVLGVTFEPFGKDHATRGGSYATGERICREVFGVEPPAPLVYEWIRLGGVGDMSSSKGNVVTISEMLEILPPEVLRYLVIRRAPKKTISFDPGMPLLNLVNDFDDTEAAGTDERSYQLSALGSVPAVGVPFKHVVTVVQIAGERGDEAVIEILERGGYEVSNREGIIGRAAYARRWLETHAPEAVKFSLQDELPEAAREVEPEAAAALGALADQLKPGLSAEDIHTMLYDTAEAAGAQPKTVFRALYLALLGKERGPRAGWFLSTLDTDFLVGRLRELTAE
jgi:lysyl-tRNA synthetase class 1